MTNKNGTVLAQDLGNTKSKSRGWCITLNNWNQDEYNSILEWCGTLTQYILGKEVGENGTPHLQIYVYNKNAISFNSVKKAIPRGHIEKAKGTLADNLKYCSKDNNYITNIKSEPVLKDPLEGKTLYKWQENLLTILKGEINDRVIYWYWEENGNLGKTSFVKSWVINNKNSICLSGRASDIKAGVVTHIEKNKELNVAFFHFTRSNEEFVSYEALEAIKDGMFFSGKYESSMCVYNTPHVVVFANFAPNEYKLSKDRWIIVNITP